MITKITPQQAKQIMEHTSQLYLVDVRNEDEYEQGHIKGALLLPLCEISYKAKEILPVKDVPVLIYCRSGARATQAAIRLNSLGYVEIYNFGGILSWQYELD